MKAIGHESNANILVTQPRRVAATSLAMRVANERRSPPPGKLGSEIGYNVRLSKAISNSTKITYCTVGILLRMLVNPRENEDYNIYHADNLSQKREYQHENEGREDNEIAITSNIPLSNISHIIIDEVHERDLNTDFALTLLRPLLQDNRNISIILMSATASSDLFVNYFRSEQLLIEPKVFCIPGRTFPVEMKWLTDCEKLVSSHLDGWRNDNGIGKSDEADKHNDINLSPRASAKIDNEFIVKLVHKLAMEQWNEELVVNEKSKSTQTKGNGAILVFLPGKGMSLRKINPIFFVNQSLYLNF